jgi:hypothetical protein
MELTIHRPIREWYSDQSKWWDLDYPPLTAYVSWICGFMYALFLFFSTIVVDLSISATARSEKKQSNDCSLLLTLGGSFSLLT